MATNDKEIWKQIPQLKGPSNKKYAVSSHGRLASYETNIEDKFVLKLHLNGGFPMATVQIDGKSKALFVHNVMAAAFLKKPSPKSNHVIHIDYDKANNALSNLKWTTKKEQVEHSMKSPMVLASAAHKIYRGATGRKLDEKKVTLLKKEIWNPKRKLSFKQIAAKYGIAEMNLYRIKNGEMWFCVHVEGEPIFPKYKTQLKNIEYHNKINAKELIIENKRKAIYNARLKANAEKRKKRETEKNARMALAVKKRKQKAIDLIAADKRRVLKAIAAKKAKDFKVKRAADFAKLSAARLIIKKKKNELKEKRAIALVKIRAAKAIAAKKAQDLKDKKLATKKTAKVKSAKKGKKKSKK